MAFFEGLKKIIPAKIAEESFEFDLKLSHTNSKSDVNFKVDKKNKVLIIYLNKLSFKENQILRKHVLKNFEANKIKFIESNSVELIEKLIDYNKKEDQLVMIQLIQVIIYMMPMEDMLLQELLVFVC